VARPSSDPPVELVPLLVGQRGQLGLGDAHRPDRPAVEQWLTTLGDGADAVLAPAGRPDLAGHEHVERCAERVGDLGSHGDAAPGQRQHHRPVQVHRAEDASQASAGVRPVVEPHRH
jgi:hypothetical protein